MLYPAELQAHLFKILFCSATFPTGPSPSPSPPALLPCEARAQEAATLSGKGPLPPALLPKGARSAPSSPAGLPSFAAASFLRS